MERMRVQMKPAVVLVLISTILLGLLYPLTVTLISQVLFPSRADGSILVHRGKQVGSELLGQSFSGAQYFKGRPFYGQRPGANWSGSSHLAPQSPDLLAQAEKLAVRYRQENGLRPGAPVPVDAVTESASGRDPHISLANALVQARRVAETRGLPERVVIGLVRQNLDGRDLGFLGDEGVNYVRLNLQLDSMSD